MSLRANVWFNYVATKANVADLPSRAAISEMMETLAIAGSALGAAPLDRARDGVPMRFPQGLSRLPGNALDPEFVSAVLAPARPAAVRQRGVKRGRRHPSPRRSMD